MKGMDSAITNLYRIREEASQDTWLHNVYPPFKLILTCLYIALVTSVSGDDIAILCSLALYPLFLFVAGNISFRSCLIRMRLVFPFLCAMGVLNLFFDREVLFHIGNLPVTGGMVSALSLLIKGLFAVLAVYLLVVTTTIEKICTSLVYLHCPQMVVTIFLLIYRYIALLMEETGRMLQAYRLRAPNQKGVRIHAWGSFVGMLLLRTFDRAGQIQESMSLRGFRGEFVSAKRLQASWTDWAYLLVFLGMILVLRLVPIFVVVGAVFV